MDSACQFGESCYRLQENHFLSFRHPHLDSILDQCDDELVIPSNYSAKVSEETLMSQLNILLWLRVSGKLPAAASVTPKNIDPVPVVPEISNSSQLRAKADAGSLKRGLNDYMSYVRKRCKGNVLQKLEYSEPYRFFLSGIASETKTHDEMLTLSFPELLNEKLGVLESSLQINFMVQIGWLLAQYAVNNEKNTPITLIYGCEDDELTNISNSKLVPTLNATYVKPSSFGSHHTKMMILSYQDQSIRIIITTGNLIEMDWENTTQGLWVSPRLPLIEEQYKNDVCDSETDFKKDLLSYLEAYNLPVLEPWINRVKSVDCRTIKVFFIASMPGTHSKNSANWGLAKMYSLLTKNAVVANEYAKDWYLLYQSSSIGSLGKDPYSWLLREFTSTMQSAKNCCSFQPLVKLIYPCFEDIVSSHDGLMAGGCLPYSKITHEKQPWLNKYLCKWRSDIRHRTKAMPHIKTYCRVSPCKKYLSWFLLTSANLSKAAWGMENKAKSNLRILNYEVGVLFVPKILISKDRLPLTNENSEDGPQFSLPYDLPVTPYTASDTPWFIDTLQNINVNVKNMQMVNLQEHEITMESNICMIGIYVTVPLLLCYWFFEVHYFLRFLLCAFVARFCKKQINVLDETTYCGICLTTDVDTLLFHMNNTRYLREVDFARADFYVRTRLWSEIRSRGGSVAQICTNIRYRRFIRPFCFYTITTRVVYWDHNSIFMEHRFMLKNNEFVNAIVMSRQRLMNCNAEEVFRALLCKQNKDNDSILSKPDLPAEYISWIECNDISSASLRANDNNEN